MKMTSPHRKTLHALHQTTHAPVTGLGRQHAASAADEALWMPNSTPWDPSDAVVPHRPQLLGAETAVHHELARAAAVADLKRALHDGCLRASLSAPPLNTVERWLLLCCWHEDAAVATHRDPLLPSAKRLPAADVALARDLQRAGLDESAAAALAAELRSRSVKAAAALRRNGHGHGSSEHGRSDSTSGRLDVQLSWVGDGAEIARLACTGVVGGGQYTVDVTRGCLDKLRTLFARHALNPSPKPCSSAAGASSHAKSATAKSAKSAKSAQSAQSAQPSQSAQCPPCGSSEASPCVIEPSAGGPLGADAEVEFTMRLFTCLLRYQSVGGLGFQASIGPAVFDELQTALGW